MKIKRTDRKERKGKCKADDGEWKEVQLMRLVCKSQRCLVCRVINDDRSWKVWYYVSSSIRFKGSVVTPNSSARINSLCNMHTSHENKHGRAWQISGLRERQAPSNNIWSKLHGWTEILKDCKGHIGTWNFTSCLIRLLLSPTNSSSLLTLSKILIDTQNPYIVLCECVVYAFSKRLSLHFPQAWVVNLGHPFHKICLMNAMENYVLKIRNSRGRVGREMLADGV